MVQHSIEDEKLGPLSNLPDMDTKEDQVRTLEWFSTRPSETEIVPPSRVLFTPAKQLASREGHPQFENHARGLKLPPNQLSGYGQPNSCTDKQPPLYSTPRETLRSRAVGTLTSNQPTTCRNARQEKLT